MTAATPARPPRPAAGPPRPAAGRLRPADLARVASVGLRTRKLRAGLSAPPPAPKVRPGILRWERPARSRHTVVSRS
jgi:hypothetical protein